MFVNSETKSQKQSLQSLQTERFHTQEIKDILDCTIVCVSHSRWLKYSPTHKAQEPKRQVTHARYEVSFLENCVLFSIGVLLLTLSAPGALLAPLGLINI